MMDCVKEKIKTSGLINGGPQNTLLEEVKLLKEIQDQSGTRKVINSELWYACAGPLVCLPQVGSLVYYFPQGHSEQVAVSTRRSAMAQVPNYPNLPSQLMCQVHNVTLHADKDTDEIYAQMSLQPVHSEKDVFAIPDFGFRTSKHPAEFFCKTLTASDTSTHGGFSVPRRAAEKLFPPLDYAAQPPTQELVVRDLHDNSWTFRHIYRGQPKRHLLTTGWSLFVGSKRLRAGDSVLFIRDEKSQLMVGVRHANRQQNALPSSVLSADSMHIGVLAAAAYASANRSLFTIFYNPRACPSEFVIPMAKYRKAVCGNQLSVGMRLGMMFETEDSSKRRYMCTIVGISDLDPLRWPGSKWRNLQVEWDEPGCNDKPTRVCAWDVETPESLFIFPSLASGKRPIHSMLLGAETEWRNLIKRSLIRVPNAANVILPCSSSSDQSMKLMTKPYNLNEAFQSAPQQNANASGSFLQDSKTTQPVINQKLKLVQSEIVCTNPNELSSLENQTTARTNSEKLKEERENSTELGSQITSAPERNEGKLNPPNQKAGSTRCSEINQQAYVSLSNSLTANGLSPFLETDDLASSSFQSLAGMGRSPLMFGSQDSLLGNDMWENQFRFDRFSHLVQPDQFACPNPNIMGSHLLDPSVSSSVLDEFCTFKEGNFGNPSDYFAGNLSSFQDVQSQITTTSFSDFPDNSGGTSSSNVDFDESSLLQNNSSWQQVAPPPPPRVRTYTKVQKTGSVGRSIDVTGFKNYDELKCAIECMFGLEGLLGDPKSSGWKLVYVDYENDVLLVGDDPWEEFVGCVRCIRILSPTEVQQMSEEGMKLLNRAALQGLKDSAS